MGPNAPLYSPLSHDPDFHELVELFVGELPDRIASMERSLREEDWGTLQRLTHQIKGAAGSYGFPLISLTAAELDATLKAGNTDTAAMIALVATVGDLCRRASAAPEPV